MPDDEYNLFESLKRRELLDRREPRLQQLDENVPSFLSTFPNQRPEIREEDQLQMPKGLMLPMAPKSRGTHRVEGGRFFDALSQLIQEHPIANTLRGVTLKRMPNDIVGTPPAGRINADPENMAKAKMSPIDVLRHEFAHIMGWGEEEAYTLHKPPQWK